MAKGDGSFYEGCAARAREMARTEAGGGASLVKNAGNLELYLFLRCDGAGVVDHGVSHSLLTPLYCARSRRSTLHALCF
jgi:hypothetical protein